MEICLMHSNVGRCILIYCNNGWYYSIDSVYNKYIYCHNIHMAINKLKRYVKDIYNNGKTIDIRKFKRIKEYDGYNAREFLYAVHSYELDIGINFDDLTALYFIYAI